MKAERKELLKALAPLKPALGRGAVVELTHIWFDGKYAYAHDGGMGVKAKLETDFDFGVSGALLLGLLNQDGPEALDLSLNKDNALTVRAGKSSVKLVTLTSERRPWPYPEKIGKPVAIIVLTEEMLTGMRRVLTVKPANPTRLEHHGISVFTADKELQLYTTDSKVLATVPVPGESKGIDSTVIPRAFAEQLIARCSAGAELKLLAKCFACEADDGLTLFSNVFDTADILELPGYVTKYAGDNSPKPFEIPEGFNAALERAVLLSGIENPAVSLKVDGKKLTMRGRFKGGELDEDFSLKVSQPVAGLDVLADKLLAIKDVSSFSVSKDALVFYSKSDDFILICSAWYDPAKASRAAAE